MPRPRFEDVHPPYDVPSCYSCTNEEPVLHRRLLDGYRFQRTGGIASSGDIMLLTLLPRSKELFLVDHSYKALALAMTKSIMLDTLGARRMKALLIEAELKDFLAAAHTASKELPAPLVGKMSFDGAFPSLNQATYQELRREWAPIPAAAIERSRRRLDKVTLIHGDLSDLERFGPFDCLYMSNAHEHQNRARVMPKFASVAPLVREDGVMLVAHSSHVTTPTNVHEGWERIRNIKGTRTSWLHQLYRRVAAVQAPQPAIPLATFTDPTSAFVNPTSAAAAPPQAIPAAATTQLAAGSSATTIVTFKGIAIGSGNS